MTQEQVPEPRGRRAAVWLVVVGLLSVAFGVVDLVLWGDRILPLIAFFGAGAGYLALGAWQLRR